MVLQVGGRRPELKCGTANKRQKPAKLSTGIEIQVRGYVGNGERVWVNTTTGEFGGRADLRPTLLQPACNSATPANGVRRRSGLRPRRLLTPHLDSGPETHAASPMKAVGGVAPTYDALGSSPCEGRGVPTGRADPKQPSPAFAGAELRDRRSEEHTSELQSLMRISYAVFCLKKKKTNT